MGAAFIHYVINAYVHSSRVSKQKFAELLFDLILFPTYSPDLISLNYHLFPTLRTFLEGTKFKLNEWIMQKVNKYFEHLEKIYYHKKSRSWKNVSK